MAIHVKFDSCIIKQRVCLCVKFWSESNLTVCCPDSLHVVEEAIVKDCVLKCDLDTVTSTVHVHSLETLL